MNKKEKKMLFEKFARANRLLDVKSEKSEWLKGEYYGYYTAIGDIVITFGLTGEFNKWKEDMEND